MTANAERMSRKKRELSRLSWALNQFGLNVSDLASDILPSLLEGNIVLELHNLDGTQLYRNMRFFQICSYNLLDLAVNSWSVLFDLEDWVKERDLKVIEGIKHNRIAEIYLPEAKPFVRKERYQFAKQLKENTLLTKAFIPVFDSKTKVASGWVTVTKVLDSREVVPRPIDESNHDGGRGNTLRLDTVLKILKALGLALGVDYVKDLIRYLLSTFRTVARLLRPAFSLIVSGVAGMLHR